MIKLNTTAAKMLKSIHIFCVTLWVGGLLAWVPLVYSMPLNDATATYITYLNLRAIAWDVIGWGGIGVFVSGILNGLLTKWGLFKHKWIIIKFVLTIAMILFGMFYTEHHMLANLELLQRLKVDALRDTVFLQTHKEIKLVVPLQLLVFFIIIMISVLKPKFKSTAE